MSRMPLKFQPLENEPRARGAPPSYRSHTMTEDSWSDYSGSSGMGKRRSSWTNLIDADVTAKVHNYNMLQQNTQQQRRLIVPPPVATSRTSSYSTDIGVVSDIFHQYMPGRTASLMATPPQPLPAGTLPSHSLPVSRAPSVITNPMPTPQQPLQQPHTSYQQKSQQDSRSKTSQKQPKKKDSKESGNNRQPGQKRNRLQEMKTWFSRPRNIWCCLLLLMLIAGGIVVAIVLSQVLPLPSEETFNWMAPGNSTGGGQAGQVRIEMKVVDKQARFQMQGAPPFKGNFINYYDFNNNQAVIIDDALKSNGRNLYCFVMPINTAAFSSVNALRKAAAKSKKKDKMTQGWEQSWTFMANPTQAPSSGFNPPIPECNGARWVTLDYAQDQRGRRCTDCFDFCLPEYGVSRDSNGPDYLNIVRQNCFYLFVPEWRSYAQSNNIEQNQRDFEAYYRNRQHLQPGFGAGNQTRWINLANVPGAISNTASGVVGAMGSGLSNMAQGVQNAVSGGINSLYPSNTNQANTNTMGVMGNPNSVNNMNTMNSPTGGYASGGALTGQQGNAVNSMQQTGSGYGVPYSQQSHHGNSGSFGSQPPGGGGQNIDPNGYATPFPGSFPRGPQFPSQVNDGNLRNEWPYGAQSPQSASDMSSINQVPVSGVVNLNGMSGSDANTRYQTGGGSSGSGLMTGVNNPNPLQNTGVSSSFPSNAPTYGRAVAPSVGVPPAAEMHGFGAQPSYLTQQYGFTNTGGDNSWSQRQATMLNNGVQNMNSGQLQSPTGYHPTGYSPPVVNQPSITFDSSLPASALNRMNQLMSSQQQGIASPYGQQQPQGAIGMNAPGQMSGASAGTYGHSATQSRLPWRVL